MAVEMRVRLPENLILRGALNREASQFGDVFLNSPPALGKRPAAGRTFLSGWIEVRFKSPQGNVADFTLDYEAYGTDETLTWGGGQLFHMSRNRLTPLRVLPGGMQGTNQGRLNLETGLVEVGSIILCGAFQNSLIGAVGALNRIPFAFPFVYPVPPFPLQVPGLDQPGAELPTPEFADIAFGTDQDGRIVSIELGSETNVPVSIFPLLGLFPPFAFGQDRRFYFGHPTHYLPDTPVRNQFTKQTAPDGIHLPAPSLFHPHLILKAEALSAIPQIRPAPARAPATLDAAVAMLGDQIVVAGGRRKNNISDAVFRTLLSDEAWSSAASLPDAVASAAYATIGSLFYVFGGYDINGDPCAHTQIYDLQKDRWTFGQPLPVALASASAVVLGDKIVVAGGLTRMDSKPRISAATFVFDPSSNEWSDAGPMLLPVAEAAVTVVNDEMWIVNGVTEQGHATSRVSTFSLHSRRWGTAPTTRDAVRKATIVLASGKILRVGGLDDQGCAVRSVAEFEPGSGEWHPGFPCVLPTAGASGVSLGESGLLIGGFDASSSDETATAPTQWFAPTTGWIVCSQPAFTSDTVYTGSIGCIAPRGLVPGCRATIVSMGIDDFVVTGQPNLWLDDVPAEVVRAGGGLIEFIVPAAAQVPFSGKKGRLRLQIGLHDLEVDIVLRTAAPSIYLLNYASLQSDPWIYEDTDYMHGASALAANHDGTLNHPDQPASPGSMMSVYATGLRAGQAVTLRCDGRTMSDAAAEDVAPLPGVVVVRWQTPAINELADGILHTIEIEVDGVISNQATVSVDRDWRPRASLPVEAGLQTVFV